MRKIDINNVQHPSRQTAIHILESITEKTGELGMFDCNNGDTTWYDFEDMVTTIIEQGKAKDKDKITRRNKQIKDLKKHLKYWEDGIIVLDKYGNICQEKLPKK